MKIGISAYYLDEPYIGIGRFTVNLINGLIEHDNKNEYILITPIKKDQKYLSKELKLVDFGFELFSKSLNHWEERFTSLDPFKNLGLDRLIIPYGVCPVECSVPYYIIFHDLIPILFMNIRKLFSNLWYLKITSLRDAIRLLRSLKRIRNAVKIYTVSDFTRCEIAERVKMSVKDIGVLYNSIDSFLEIEERPVSSKVMFEKPYLLHVGGIGIRKNLTGVLKAYSKLDNKLRDKHLLVVVGYMPEDDKWIDKLKDLDIYQNVRFLKWIDEAELKYLYKHAQALVFPSYYEGFGLPPVEAMASGCPVITSNQASLPEVTGDAALICDPFDINDIKSKITKVLTDDKLRKRLVDNGYVNAERFLRKEIFPPFVEEINRSIDG